MIDAVADDIAIALKLLHTEEMLDQEGKSMKKNGKKPRSKKCRARKSHKVRSRKFTKWQQVINFE